MELLLRLENFTGTDIKEDGELYNLLKKVWIEKGFNEEDLEKYSIEEIVERLKGTDEFKNTSYVPTAKIKELLEEYLKHIEKGLNEEEVIEKIYQKNKGNISKDEIKRFILKQKEIAEKLKITKPDESEEVPNDIAIENNKIIKIESLANNLLNNQNLGRKRVEVKNEIEEVISRAMEGEVVNMTDEVKRVFNKYLEIKLTSGESTQLETKTKSVRIEVERWIEENKDDLRVLKQKRLEEKIEKKIIEDNKDLNVEEKKAVKEYSQIVGQIFFPKKGGIDKHKKELKTKDVTDDSWADVSVLSTVLKMQSSQFNDFLDKFKSIKSKIAKVKLPNEIVECRSIERIVELVEMNEEIRNLLYINQRYVGFFGKIGGILGKKWGERIGLQSTNSFIKESLTILAKNETKQGVVMILKGVLSGGVRAAAVGTAEVGGVAASQAIPVVGQIILIGAVVIGAVKKVKEVIKPAVTAVKDIFEKFGIDLSGFSLNTKKFFQEHLGTFFGGIIDSGIKVGMVMVAIPGILLARPLTTLVSPLVLFVIIGFMIYSTLNSNLISSLVPPTSMGGSESQGQPIINPPANLPESCPSIWPSPYGCITQGPQTAKSHEGSEAIDIGCLSFGDAVYATHDGVATPFWSETCGYGVHVFSTCNEVRFYTYFCHFPYQVISGPTQVKKGDKIGEVDDTGNSRGSHIHYQLSGLGKINDYLPRKVPEGCIDIEPCGKLYIDSFNE